MRGGLAYFLDGRLFEWVFSMGTLWLAVAIIIWPEMITIGAFSHLTDFMSADRVAAFALIVSLSGLAALATNGGSRVTGPIVRSICATSRAFLWAQFSYALFLWGIDRGTPALILGFWVLFTVAEFYLSYRAMIDVRHRIEVRVSVDRTV